MGLDNAQLFERLGVALALGLLMGMERGWERRGLAEGLRVAGLRTFGLISLLGAVTVAIAGNSRGLLLAAVALGVGAILALGYWRESRSEAEFGVTTEIAAMLAFGLGALAGYGELAAASSAAVVVTLLLGFKPELHGLLQRIEREELLATLRLLLISVVLLPILPNKGFGPWEAFNPYQLWWMVVLIAGISYLGYVATRMLGARRGILLTGLFGGLVSSTAVAIALAHRVRDDEPTRRVCAAAIVAAAATMFPRMLVIAVVVAPPLLAPMVYPLALAAVVAFGPAAWYARSAGDRPVNWDDPGLQPQNPLDLGFALKFGLLLAVIMVLARAAMATMGAHGLYGLAAISGLVDVDAITLSAASMFTQGQTALASAAVAILIAAVVNTIVKPTLVMVISGRRIAWRVWLPLLAALGAGALGCWFGAGQIFIAAGA
jgi:uncharacterized membrane protein (DUF4010 family)